MALSQNKKGRWVLHKPRSKSSLGVEILPPAVLYDFPSAVRDKSTQVVTVAQNVEEIEGMSTLTEERGDLQKNGISGNINRIAFWTCVCITYLDAPSNSHRKPETQSFFPRSTKRGRNIFKITWTNTVTSLPFWVSCDGVLGEVKEGFALQWYEPHIDTSVRGSSIPTMCRMSQQTSQVRRSQSVPPFGGQPTYLII